MRQPLLFTKNDLLSSLFSRQFIICSDDERSDNVSDRDDQGDDAVDKEQRIAGVIDASRQDHRQDRQNEKDDTGDEAELDHLLRRICPDHVTDHADRDLDRADQTDDDDEDSETDDTDLFTRLFEADDR